MKTGPNRKRKVASDLILQLLPREVQQTCSPAQSPHFQLGIMKMMSLLIAKISMDFFSVIQDHETHVIDK